MHKTFARLLSGLAVLMAGPAFAQGAYPEQPISIVVPFAPGGASDITARVLADQLAKDTGWKIIVENKAGAGGSIAATQVARAAADGYTLLFGTTNTNGINSYMYKLNYDAVKSFEPVGFVAENVVVLLANASFPANNLDEAIALIRKEPGKYSYASPGQGTVHQLAMELLKKSKDLQLTHIPYKGAGPAMVDLVGDTVPLMIGGIAPAKSFIESGKVKVLAVANDRKFKNVPANVQYFSDAAPDAAVSSWLGLFAPKGTPSERIKTLSDALQKSLSSPELQKTLEDQGMQAEFMSPQAFGKQVEDGMGFWKKAVDAAGIKSE